METTSKLVVYFTGGTEQEYVTPEARSLADKLKKDGWVKINDFEVNAGNVIQVKVVDFKEDEVDEDDELVYYE